MLTQDYYQISCVLYLLTILCWIRVRGKFRDYSIINAHAPTEDKDDEEKDNFYLEPKTVYSQRPKHDIKTVLGDCNAKLGKEENNYPHAGSNGFHEECNGNGHKLVQFAAARYYYWGNYIHSYEYTQSDMEVTG
jgi:hypothetical protein